MAIVTTSDKQHKIQVHWSRKAVQLLCKKAYQYKGVNTYCILQQDTEQDQDKVQWLCRKNINTNIRTPYNQSYKE